jgi:hypothetical protein
MPALTNRDKRTIRIAAAAILIYLALFFGLRSWKSLEATRSEYQKLVKEAQNLKQELKPYENKVLLIEKLKGNFSIDPSKLSKASLVAEASAAIQKAAQSGGVQVGPIRESSARPSAKELASMQLEATGPVPAIVSLLHRLTTLGYPLVLDSVQINADPMRPNMIKLNLTVIVVDVEQWKKEEPRNV